MEALKKCAVLTFISVLGRVLIRNNELCQNSVTIIINY